MLRCSELTGLSTLALFLLQTTLFRLRAKIGPFRDLISKQVHFSISILQVWGNFIDIDNRVLADVDNIISGAAGRSGQSRDNLSKGKESHTAPRLTPYAY